MKVISAVCALSLVALGASSAMAQAPTSAKPVIKTTCADYVAFNETVKPAFIVYAVGHSKKGRPEAVFDEAFVERVKPEVDQFCAVNLTQSAYDKVIASSIASERAARRHK